MSEELRISAKNLGAMAMEDYCPRCFWIRLKTKGHLPWQIFPGIFSSIDSYTKKILHGYFDRHGEPPPWLTEAFREAGFPAPLGYVDPPSIQKFQHVDPDTNIRLTGAADAILKMGDDSYMIADYKTARYNPDKVDHLLPTYEVQLNGYTIIAENFALKGDMTPVRHLALLYMDPSTEQTDADADENWRNDGFAMSFTAHVRPIELDRDKIEPHLAGARALHDRETSPDRRDGCKDCERLEAIIGLL